MFTLLLSSIYAYIYLVKSQYYVGITASATWYEAEEACRTGVYILATNGKLATWDDYNTYNNKVKPAYTALGARSWVGLNDLGTGEYGGSNTEGDWHFVDGRDCGGSCLSSSVIGNNGLSEWSPNEPNEHGCDGEDCAEIWEHDDQAGNSYGLNDANCDDSRSFICEFTSLITPSVGKQNIDIPISNPLNNPSGGNDYYIMEFTSFKDIIFLSSVVLNVALIVMVCWCLGIKGCCNIEARTTRYSKVNMYATEDEKL